MKLQEITGEFINLQEITGDILKIQEFTGVYRITGGLGGLDLFPYIRKGGGWQVCSHQVGVAIHAGGYFL